MRSRVGRLNSSAGFGGIVGGLWVPRRVAVGFAAGLAAGVLVGLVVPTGDWAPVLAVGLRALLFVGFALIALLVAVAAYTAIRSTIAIT